MISVEEAWDVLRGGGSGGGRVMSWTVDSVEHVGVSKPSSSSTLFLSDASASITNTRTLSLQARII